MRPRGLFKRWRIALETLLIVAGIVLVKLLTERLGLELISLSPVFTSIVASSLFLFSIILSGTMSDYKEGERIPADLVALCERVWAEGRYTQAAFPGFGLDGLRGLLIGLLDDFQADLGDPQSRKALHTLSGFGAVVLEMERLGVPVQTLTRLKDLEGELRRVLLRVYYIQRISFLPSSFVLVESSVFLIIILLILSKLDPFYEALTVIVLLSYILIYVLKLLRLLDTPFDPRSKTQDSVSLFLLREFRERLGNEAIPR